jgi:hypothetical protein
MQVTLDLAIVVGTLERFLELPLHHLQTTYNVFYATSNGPSVTHVTLLGLEPHLEVASASDDSK